MKSYSIRRSFLLPLGILLLESLLLFAVVVAQGQPKAKAIILGFMIVPVAGLFVESFFRRVVVGDTAVSVFRPFRQKNMNFAEMTSVETIRVKKRVFMTLSSESDFIILSNAYAEFPDLVKTLLDRVPAATISDETVEMAESPPVKSSDIVSCWFGAILLAIILVLQFV